MKKRTSAAVHIPVEHQSAPKESWADKEVRKAAEEIASGQFQPTIDEDDFLAVGLARGTAVKDPSKTGPEKLRVLQETADSLALAQHPRVQEALARLEQEKRESRNSQEMLEKTQMLHEMNSRAAKPNQWDGQGRWMGKEAEEMRVVNILTPMQFLRRLEGAIGEGRVFLNRFAVMHRVALLVHSDEKRLLEQASQIPIIGQKSKDDIVVVGTLQYPCGPEWMVMRFDEYGIPKNAKYLGWRTALLSMIDLGVIAEKEAHKAFPLALGPAGNWYREQLQRIRSRDGVVN